MTFRLDAMNAATPFSKILIANRGEIALRVIRSARALGYRTVAVYSTVDVHAAHVADADQSVCIGEPLPAQSYRGAGALVRPLVRLLGGERQPPLPGRTAFDDKAHVVAHAADREILDVQTQRQGAECLDDLTRCFQSA